MSRRSLPCMATVLVLLCAMSGCYYPLNEDNLVGHYKGVYAGGVEDLVIRRDGTFSQTFRKAEAVEYSNSGTWEIRGDGVVLRRFVRAMHHARLEFDPQLVDEEKAAWDDMAQVLILSPDYWLTRQPSAGNGADSGSPGTTHP